MDPFKEDITNPECDEVYYQTPEELKVKNNPEPDVVHDDSLPSDEEKEKEKKEDDEEEEKDKEEKEDDDKDNEDEEKEDKDHEDDDDDLNPSDAGFSELLKALSNENFPDDDE